jgi:hypothetical protein
MPATKGRSNASIDDRAILAHPLPVASGSLQAGQFGNRMNVVQFEAPHKPHQILVDAMAPVISQRMDLIDQVGIVLGSKRGHETVIASARVGLMTGRALLMKDTAP